MENNKTKPQCQLSGQDGNIYNLLSIASLALKNAGLSKEAKEMWDRVTSSDSYEKALCIIMEYVEAN